MGGGIGRVVLCAFSSVCLLYSFLLPFRFSFLLSSSCNFLCDFMFGTLLLLLCSRLICILGLALSPDPCYYSYGHTRFRSDRHVVLCAYRWNWSRSSVQINVVCFILMQLVTFVTVVILRCFSCKPPIFCPVPILRFVGQTWRPLFGLFARHL